MLAHLMAHPDEVVSKGAILEEVWGHNSEGDPNVVEVYVGYLRKKVDAPFERRSIRTIRGVGYRVIDDLR